MINLIAAQSTNRIIGKNGGIPWKCPTDMRHFVALTKGKTVLMGRKTYESMGGGLKGRTNIVLSSREPPPTPEGAPTTIWVKDILEGLNHSPEIWVIGGEYLYRAALAAADHIYLTEIMAHIDGDTRFPHLDPQQWQPEDPKPEIVKSEKDEYPMRFFKYNRIKY